MKKYIVGLLSIVLIAGGVFFGWWKINKEESFERKNKVTLTGQLEDKDGKLLSNQEIKLSYKKEEIKVKTDNSGYFYTHIEKNKEYDLSSKELEGTILAKNDDAVKTTMKKGSYFSGKKIDTDDTVTVLRNKAIELDPDNFIYEVASDYREVTIFSGKEKNEKLDFLIGDIIAIPAQVDYISGLGLKIIAIEKESDNYILTTEQAAVEDVLKSFETKGDGYEIDVKDAYLELSDDVQLLDEGQQGVAWGKPKIDTSKTFKLDSSLKITFPSDELANSILKEKEKKGLKKRTKTEKLRDNLSFKLTNNIEGTMMMDFKIDFDNLDATNILLTNKLRLKTSVIMDVDVATYDRDKIKLGQIPMSFKSPYVSADLPLYVKIGADGVVSIDQSFNSPTAEIESGIKDGKLVNNIEIKKFNEINNPTEREAPQDLEAGFGFDFSIGIGAEIKALSLIPIIELTAFAGPSYDLELKAQLDDGTVLAKSEFALIKLSLGVDPCYLKPLVDSLIPKIDYEENGKSQSVVDAEIEFYSKSFRETKYEWLLKAQYNKLLSVMDKAENLVNTEESIDSKEYKELVNLVEGRHEKNRDIDFIKLRTELEKKDPVILSTIPLKGEDEQQLFTTQKAINEFTEYIEELLSTVAVEIEETSKSSSKNFDQLPQATQFVVISSLLDSRLTNLIYDGPEVFNNGGTIGATYYEDTQRFSFQAHSGAGVGHPIIDWEIRENDVLFIQSIHRSSFDEYEKKLPKNEVSGSISKSDLFELYERYAEHYDKWGAGTSVKKESIDPKEYLNESEAMSEKTTIREIILPSIDDIELTEK